MRRSSACGVFDHAALQEAARKRHAARGVAGRVSLEPQGDAAVVGRAGEDGRGERRQLLGFERGQRDRATRFEQFRVCVSLGRKFVGGGGRQHEQRQLACRVRHRDQQPQ